MRMHRTTDMQGQNNESQMGLIGTKFQRMY